MYSVMYLQVVLLCRLGARRNIIPRFVSVSWVKTLFARRCLLPHEPIQRIIIEFSVCFVPKVLRASVRVYTWRWNFILPLPLKWLLLQEVDVCRLRPTSSGNCIPLQVPREISSSSVSDFGNKICLYYSFSWYRRNLLPSRRYRMRTCHRWLHPTVPLVGASLCLALLPWTRLQGCTSFVLTLQSVPSNEYCFHDIATHLFVCQYSFPFVSATVVIV
jgi:hypothetical protein